VANLENFINKTKARAINDKVLRRVLATIHTQVDQRIFRDGIDASERLIGTYSEGYQKTRRRKNYPVSRKVILQATSQMVNDFKFGVFNGKYGSGFSNQFNFNKSVWVEKTYEKEIFKLTNSEDKKLEKILDKELDRYLKKL